MILPGGVNKSAGFCAALRDLQLSPHNVIGVGDAENEHAFLTACECSAAVANAIPSLKETASFVTHGARGEGVREIVEELVENDRSGRSGATARPIPVGRLERQEVALPVYGDNLLACGVSGSGKSTLVTGLVERIMHRKYQVCLIDPEGDYRKWPAAEPLAMRRTSQKSGK